MPFRPELNTISQEKIYPTVWGNITFEELYHNTQKIVAQKLQHKGLNSQDIEDCLQSAYFKVWQKLEVNPDIFSEKSLSYVLQSIYFHSKAQRFSQQRYKHKIAYNSETIQDSHLTPQRIDHWIDLQTAISAVIELVKDIPFALFALYTLITSVKVSEIQKILGCSKSTLIRHRKYIRELLAQHLPHYDYNNIYQGKKNNPDLVTMSVASALLEL